MLVSTSLGRWSSVVSGLKCGPCKFDVLPSRGKPSCAEMTGLAGSARWNQQPLATFTCEGIWVHRPTLVDLGRPLHRKTRPAFFDFLRKRQAFDLASRSTHQQPSSGNLRVFGVAGNLAFILLQIRRLTRTRLIQPAPSSCAELLFCYLDLRGLSRGQILLQKLHWAMMHSAILGISTPC